MSTKTRLKLVAAIACDDIRIEVNNKIFIIGAYSGDVTVPRFPTTLNLRIYLGFEHLDKGDHKFDLRLVAPGGDEYVLTAEVAVVADDAPGAIPTPVFNIECQEEGSIEVHVKMDDGKWMHALSKRVIQAPPPAAA